MGSSLRVFTNTLFHHFISSQNFAHIYTSSQAVPFRLSLVFPVTWPTTSPSAQNARPQGDNIQPATHSCYLDCYVSFSCQPLKIYAALMYVIPVPPALSALSVAAPSGLILTDDLYPFFSANGPETARADQLEQPTPSELSLARCIRRDSCSTAE